jgi:hypothetical protein
MTKLLLRLYAVPAYLTYLAGVRVAEDSITFSFFKFPPEDVEPLKELFGVKDQVIKTFNYNGRPILSFILTPSEEETAHPTIASI